MFLNFKTTTASQFVL